MQAAARSSATAARPLTETWENTSGTVRALTPRMRNLIGLIGISLAAGCAVDATGESVLAKEDAALVCATLPGQHIVRAAASDADAFRAGYLSAKLLGLENPVKGTCAGPGICVASPATCTWEQCNRMQCPGWSCFGHPMRREYDVNGILTRWAGRVRAADLDSAFANPLNPLTVGERVEYTAFRLESLVVVDWQCEDDGGV